MSGAFGRGEVVLKPAAGCAIVWRSRGGGADGTVVPWRFRGVAQSG